MAGYMSGGRTVGGQMANGSTTNNAASTSGGGWSNAGGGRGSGKGSKSKSKKTSKQASFDSNLKAKKAKTVDSYGVLDSISHNLEQGWNSLKSAVKPATNALGITKADRSVHSYKDGGSRETISGNTYATAQKGMYSGLRNSKGLGTLSPTGAKVLSGYDAGRYGAFAADVVGSKAGIAGLAVSNLARQAFHNASPSTLGVADGLALGGMSLSGSALGSTLGAVGGPIGSMLGGYIGGYLGNDANAQSLGLASNSPNSIAGYNPSSTSLGMLSNPSHPALNSNIGNGGNGGGHNNSQVIAQSPTTGGDSIPPFDWSQWSHLYTPDTVYKALTRPLPRKTADLTRSNYV